MASSATGIAANPIATIATASIHERTVILGTPIAWLRQLTFLDHRCNFPPRRRAPLSAAPVEDAKPSALASSNPRLLYFILRYSST